MVLDVERGLSTAEVADRAASGRGNDVPAGPSRTVAQIVRANVLTRFNALLGGMLVVIVIVAPFQDALFGVVLVANTAIGIFQELRAKRTLDRIRVLAAPRARVVRDGVLGEVAVGQVVAEDLLEAATGDQIVVDGRVVATDGLEVDESLLTGEAEPVRKTVGDEVRSGSFVVAGLGRYRATKVGAEAYAVRLAAEARRFTLTRSELRSGTDRILVYVAWAIVPTAILLFWSQLRVYDGVVAAASGAVAGTVAMVPEGLILLTSLAFSVAVVRLARRRVLVQELAAVEVLARVDVLCIDKTGTLTRGRLSVEAVERLDGTDPAQALAALAAADPAANPTLRAIGEAFPGGSDGWVAQARVAFSSARGWSGASFGARGAWILGAPDVVLPIGAMRSRLEQTAAQGVRVVVLARTETLPDADLPGEVEPVAAIRLGDPLRPSAAETLAFFAAQGVKVKVLSGDHPAAVRAIAAAAGLDGAEEAVDARTLEEEGLAEALASHDVFGRVTPQRKREMVRALQRGGHVVAMTGDGVNDALALKDADIGVAMGSGSDATRAVAQLVLLDSSFDALPSVVAEGRRVLGNIERTSALYLTKTLYAMLIALATGVFEFAFPFLPRHLTLIGSLTIGIPSFFLALAPNGERFRPGFVRRVLRFAVPAGILAALATLFAYALARREPGIDLGQARTAAVLTLTWIGFGVLWIVAAPLTAWRLALVWGLVAGSVAVLAIPGTRTFFALELPPIVVSLAGIGIAAIVWSFARLFVPDRSAVGPG
ncbi:MAG: HAD-IC family P-type ATPase [Actinomycetota bacterium]